MWFVKIKTHNANNNNKTKQKQQPWPSALKHTHTHLHACMQVHSRTLIHTHTHSYACMQGHSHTRSHTHTHTHTSICYTHTHTHTKTPRHGHKVHKDLFTGEGAARSGEYSQRQSCSRSTPRSSPLGSQVWSWSGCGPQSPETTVHVWWQFAINCPYWTVNM